VGLEAAIAELGYRPSSSARNLSLGRTQTVGVLVPDLENPMFQEVLRGVTHAAAAQGYRVLVADSQESLADEPELALEARRRCDALVLCAPRMPGDELRALLPRLAPVVLVNRQLEGSATPDVAIDYAAASAAALAHLAALGHSRIAYLAGPVSSESNRRRLRGLAGAAVVEIPCGGTIADGSAAVAAVVESGVTAVIAFNDLVAFGLLAALRERGVAVPGEISVIGFDDIPFAPYASPPLTTMAVPRLELGARAWDALRAEIEGAPAPPRALFTPELIVRSSTAAVRPDPLEDQP
jgi:LacI family transcriptional regulator